MTVEEIDRKDIYAHRRPEGGAYKCKKIGTNSLPSGFLYYQYYKSLNPAASPSVGISLNLIIFANSLDPDEAKQFGPRSGQTNFWPELDQKCLTLMEFLN